MADVTRRAAIGMVGAAAVGAAVSRALPAQAATVTFRQSACRSCFGDLPLRDVLQAVRAAGLDAVDLLHADEWDTARREGLVCSAGYGGAGTVTDGLNDPANHAAIVRHLERSLPAAARAGVPNVIAFVGSRRGRSNAEGLDHCAAVLRRVAPVAEQEGVTLVVELLNSRVDYPDHQGDRLAFGAELIDRVDSPRVRLLYDLYHMQVMEGNVIQTIRDHHHRIAHYHAAGVPGRRELDRHQELHWPAIARAIAETGFTGYVAHEFMSTGDPIAALRRTVARADA